MVEVHPIAKIISEHGVDSADLSMFSEEQRRMIYSQAADILLRLNKFEHAFIAMERAGRPLPIEQIKKVAENKMMMGQYREAYDLLVKTGQNELAEFVRINFL
ncbi:hypothetical protein KY363_02750 [Candidatus Woesearchaeota archaeon]|nr:hypothetical protein [Candidatus Woesearchaeota archaeon]